VWARRRAGPSSTRAQRTGVAALRAAGAGRGIGVSRGSRGVPGGGRGGQGLERPQEALLTDETARDVDAGDAQHQVPGRLRRDGRRGWLRQECPALRERRGAPAIGEQAEVADADEAVGADVEEEATEKLVDREFHHLPAVPVGVVAPAEADATIAEGERPVVGERDAVGVAAEIGEHVLGPREGRKVRDICWR
jgi:hypothetical protein